MTIRFDTNGTATCIATGQLDLTALGTVSKRRASHVEPASRVLRVVFHATRRVFGEAGRCAAWTRSWCCVWRVDLRPSSGTILTATWRNRADALAAEVAWLETNVIRS